jgi:hypothetical protein
LLSKQSRNHFTCTQTYVKIVCSTCFSLYLKLRRLVTWLSFLEFFTLFAFLHCVLPTNISSVDFLVAGNVDEQHRRSYSWAGGWCRNYSYFCENCKEKGDFFSNQRLLRYFLLPMLIFPYSLFGIFLCMQSDLPVRERIFLLLDATQTSLGGASGKFPQYYKAYYDLVVSAYM